MLRRLFLYYPSYTIPFTHEIHLTLTSFCINPLVGRFAGAAYGF